MNQLLKKITKQYNKMRAEAEAREDEKYRKISSPSSTAIKQPYYNEEEMSLEVTYKSKGRPTYKYYGVTKEEAEGLEETSSAGRYNYYNIRPKPFVKL
mgnify:CR=1 FL=1